MSDKLVIFDEVQHKVLKIRIYPNQDQTILINKTFGSCRKLYNEHLQERNEFYIDNILPIPKEERQLKSKEIYKTKNRKRMENHISLYERNQFCRSTAGENGLRPSIREFLQIK